MQKQLATGRYADAEDVVRTALHALDDGSGWTDEDRQLLDARIDRAMAQFERGEGIPGDVAFARLHEKKAAWKKEHLTTPK